MVLKKIFLPISVFFILTNECYSQNSNYWQNLIQTAFKNNPNVQEIKLEYDSALINKKQYDYQWFPQFTGSLQESTNLAPGKNYYLLNQESNSSYVHIFSPQIKLALYQKLPGNGSLGLTTSYGFNYLAERNVFQQWPQINFSINQTISRGMLGITGNPESRLINEQFYYSDITYRRNLSSQIQQILSLIQNFDTLNAQEDYYLALQNEYKSELITAQNKETAGLQSSMESYYAKNQLTEVQNTLKDLQNNKQQLLNEIILLIPDFETKALTEQRNELVKIISELYNTTNTESKSLETNLYNTIYSSIQKQHLYQFQNEENNYAPQLFINSSVSPDSTANAYYSDWYKSFRIFTENATPLILSVSIGIQKTFELPGAKKLRKEIYQMNRKSIEEQIFYSNQTQTFQLDILKSQIKKDSDYLSKLEEEILTEQDFREKRKNLFLPEPYYTK